MTAHTDDWRGEGKIRGMKSAQTGRALFNGDSPERRAFRAECLRLASEGLTMAQIAKRVGMAPSKVSDHIRAARGASA
jgi:DNA-binding NarL/FixJ family response regulator